MTYNLHQLIPLTEKIKCTNNITIGAEANILGYRPIFLTHFKALL